MKALLTLPLFFAFAAHASLNYGANVEPKDNDHQEKVIDDQKSLPEKKQSSTIQGEIQKEEAETSDTNWHGNRHRKSGQLVPYGIK